MPNLTGARISRYEILEPLGSGGMGEVYRARDQDLGRDVAIKFLPERFATSPERLARFGQEARTASSLNHPNIITIHEIGAAPGVPPYIVMEYVEGRTLRAILQAEGRLAPGFALDIAAQLAEGTAKAHSAGIVHRDLKPENVMITGDGLLKILDFGLAKLRSGLPASTAALAAADTQETAPSPDTAMGALVGTAAYMSPEQARGEDADLHADQFAIGVMLYEMATGRPPFRGASFVQTLTAIIESEPPPIEASRPDFPLAARDVVARCLSKSPHGRYASTLDLARDLRQARERLSGTGSDTGGIPGIVDDSRPASRTWVRLAGAALVVVLAALLFAVGTGRIARWWTPLPTEKRLAVLPVTFDGAPQDAHCCPGLQEYVVGRLAELQRFRNRLAVLPVAEVLDAGVRSPSAASRALGANLALSISVHAAGRDRLVTVSLAATAPVRQLRGASQTLAAATLSPEAVVALAAPLLDLELGPEEERRWSGTASQVSAAGALFAQALGQTPYQQARSALERFDQQASVERAIDLFNRAIDLDPRYAAAHAGLAEARLRLFRLTKRADDLSLAAQSAARALEIDDTRPAAWTTLGMVRSARGDIAGAEQAFSEAIRRNPAGAEIFQELGTAYLRAGRPADAEKAHRKAVALDPQSWSAHAALGTFFVRQQRFADAESAYKDALKLAPGNPRLLSNLGGVYLYERRWADAEATLRQAVNDEPYGAALSNLGWLQFRIRRQYADAARTFERATASAPRDYRVWKNLASAHQLTGQRDRAAAALRTAVGLLVEERGIDPRNAKVLVELGDCYALLGEADQARPLVAEARRLAPADGDVAYTAATAYEAIGDREAALQAISAALDAGYDLLEVESDRGLAQLRADPRYGALLKQHGHPAGGQVRP